MTIENALIRLADAFGDQFSTAAAVRDHHGQNESYFPVTLPDGVLFPRSTEEVSQAVRICADEGCPVVAWGVGTSLEGHALAFQGGISLDMSRMD
ncbi:MAG: D-lactate dehydrogenase (cytochrome), partial [Paracoccaceae bacterium]